MPKFLIKATFTAEGLKGLRKDKGSGRERAVAAACESVGGKLDAMYFALGDDDVFVVADLPSHAHAVAMATTASASGMVRTCTVPLLTCGEMDEALGTEVKYRPPGSA